MQASPDIMVISVLVFIVGWIIIYYVTRYRIWLSILQRALIMAAYSLLVLGVAWVIGPLLSGDSRVLLAFGIPVGIISGVGFVGFYLSEWANLRKLKRHRRLADRFRKEGNWQSASFHEAMFERLLPLNGKLKELKTLGFIEEEKRRGTKQ